MRVKNESLCKERHSEGSCTDQEATPGHRLNSGVFVPSWTWRGQVPREVGRKGRRKMMFPLGARRYCFAVLNR